MNRPFAPRTPEAMPESRKREPFSFSGSVHWRRARAGFLLLAVLTAPALPLTADIPEQETQLSLELQYQEATDDGFEVLTRQETWDPEATAIIVCDMWDLHHSRNAVKRLEQFAPRLNEVLKAARERGVTIIHSPSDCMDYYTDDPARQRAIAAPAAPEAPPGVDQWCLQVPEEERADYPIDQFDGGEDDDPDKLAAWAEHLKTLGRNPAAPWVKQTELLTIDPERDFISSLGDEVWNILEHREIDNVILAGVHLNMCVLGRPFGLRQMVRGGKNVVLLRDMTDTMYDPERWPYVDHFTGTDLMVAYVERHICPTVTSDQFVGGEPFRFENDTRDVRGQAAVEAVEAQLSENPRNRWVKVSISPSAENPVPADQTRPAWYRSVLRIPEAWAEARIRLRLPAGSAGGYQAWINGHSLEPKPKGGHPSFSVPTEALDLGTGNLLVIRAEPGARLTAAPTLVADTHNLKLSGHWQFRLGDDPSFPSIPLPAQFAAPADIVFQPPEKVR